MKETNDQIKDMPMTLGQAGVALRNNFQFIVGDVQKATNGFSTFAAVVNKFAENLDVILIPVLAGTLLAVNKLRLGFVALNATMRANPVIALISGFAAVLSAAYIFRNEIGTVFQEVFKRMLPNMIDRFKIKFKELQKMISFKEKDKELDAEIVQLTKNIEKRTKAEFKKINIPSFMDMLLGRDPDGGDGDGGDDNELTQEQGLFRRIEYENLSKGNIDYFNNIEKYGNTTAGTIPLCLWEWEPKLKKGDNIILSAFGGGFTWGAVYLKWAYNS